MLHKRLVFYAICMETVQTSYLMRINGPAWRRLLLSCRKNTQQVRAGTNCGHYCSLALHHQGRTPGSSSGSSNSWRQAVIDARSYLIRYYTYFRRVSQCCNSYKLLHTLPTSPLWYSTVWVKKNPPPPTVFWNFFPNGWEFLINFYTPIIRSFLH